MMPILVYSIIITVAWAAATIYLLVNSAKISYLKDVSASSGFTQPSVAIVIAVRNEEADIEAALSTVCKLEYSNKKIIVINDRSTDRTPLILDKAAAENPAISIVTINELPAGWLGKNHALYQGYLASNEEWLLFTDADIIYNSAALSRAISYALANQLDHLTALPEITSRSVVLKSVMGTFAIMLELRLRPWKVSDPNSGASIGVGAFNLVKRSAYQKAGTHIPISLRPDDDLKLGEMIKKAGLRQGVVYGEKEIWLEWYTSLADFIKGLMKNTFSVSNYHLPTALSQALLTFFVFVLPLPVLLMQQQPGLFMALAIILSQVVLMVFKKGTHGKWWHALMIPVAGAIIMYILIKSAVETLRQGGIYWRDSFYPLHELRKQR